MQVERNLYALIAERVLNMMRKPKHRRVPWYAARQTWMLFWIVTFEIIIGWGTITIVFWIDSVQNLTILSIAILIIMCTLGLQLAITTPAEKVPNGKAEKLISGSSF
jgi:hypothetical protein